MSTKDDSSNEPRRSFLDKRALMRRRLMRYSSPTIAGAYRHLVEEKAEMSLKGKYYLCVGGWVLAVTDGDRHYISSHRLPLLYSVNMWACMFIDPEVGNRESQPSHQWIGVDPLDIDDLIKLHPSQTGEYKLPPVLQLPLDTTVVALVRGYHDSHASIGRGNILPILADALQDTGWDTPEQEVFLRRLRTGRPFINVPLSFLDCESRASAVEFAKNMRNDPEFRAKQETLGYKIRSTGRSELGEDNPSEN